MRPEGPTTTVIVGCAVGLFCMTPLCYWRYEQAVLLRELREFSAYRDDSVTHHLRRRRLTRSEGDEPSYLEGLEPTSTTLPTEEGEGPGASSTSLPLSTSLVWTSTSLSTAAVRSEPGWVQEVVRWLLGLGGCFLKAALVIYTARGLDRSLRGSSCRTSCLGRL